MSLSIDDVLRDDWQRVHGYQEEVSCDSCPETRLVRFLAGEPEDTNELDCQCGGRFGVR